MRLENFKFYNNNLEHSEIWFLSDCFFSPSFLWLLISVTYEPLANLIFTKFEPFQKFCSRYFDNSLWSYFNFWSVFGYIFFWCILRTLPGRPFEIFLPSNQVTSCSKNFSPLSSFLLIDLQSSTANFSTPFPISSIDSLPLELFEIFLLSSFLGGPFLVGDREDLKIWNVYILRAHIKVLGTAQQFSTQAARVCIMHIWLVVFFILSLIDECCSNNIISKLIFKKVFRLKLLQLLFPWTCNFCMQKI